MNAKQSKSKKSENKQAVLLIHGIGEQQPMKTLRGFVDTVWTKNKDLHRHHTKGAYTWSKPYTLSENFELRRITTPQNVAGIRTDFFEFYWQHLMQGTKVSHVINWARKLLVRYPSTVPKHLLLTYVVLVILAIIGIGLAYRGFVTDNSTPSWLPSWASFVLSIGFVPLLMWIIISIVGDAARYLQPAPPNIQRRHEIRSAGVQVIKALHKRGYRRIIVVGHSLGSVIGYEILNYAWAEFNTAKPKANTPSFDALNALEDTTVQLDDAPNSVVIDAVQNGQRRYFNELMGNMLKWRVTDFVTLGCPLAHAEVLMAKNADDLKMKIENREYPRCPPVLEKSTVNNKIVRLFSYPAKDSARTPHHAAVFAPSRWTNLYFPNRFIVWGDLVGGPLARIFGPGIRDVPVCTSKWWGFFSHTFYWKFDDKKDSHIAALNDALDLADRQNGQT